MFTNIHSATVDPKHFDDKSFVDIQSDVCVIPPNSFALARTVEYFRIPRSVLTICLGKSTYARCGIIVNVTPLEPEWEGHVTLEFSNTTNLPAKIYANEGVAQMLFLRVMKSARRHTLIGVVSIKAKPASRYLRLNLLVELNGQTVEHSLLELEAEAVTVIFLDKANEHIFKRGREPKRCPSR